MFWSWSESVAQIPERFQEFVHALDRVLLPFAGIEEAMRGTIVAYQLATIPSPFHFRSECLRRRVGHCCVSLAMEDDGGWSTIVDMMCRRDIFRPGAEPLLGNLGATQVEFVTGQRRQHQSGIEQ